MATACVVRGSKEGVNSMTPLQLNDFEAYFRALNDNHAPFPWQRALAERVASATDADKAWPEALALPTASGKTACIEIAVFALAYQWDRGEKRTAPRRIFFVVDRRVIVDEAFDRAEKLATRLLRPDCPVLEAVAERLWALAGGTKYADKPLACFQLRGGIYRDDAWAKTPIQPTVIASTVDQIGSRLLYRGYGLRSGSARPIHAGLAGNDCLLLLDEAHCAVPFGQTVAAVKRYRRWGDRLARAPFYFVPMSATVRTDGAAVATDVLRLTDPDRADLELGRRLVAGKPTRLVEAKKAKGPAALERLAEELAAQAVGLTKSHPVKRIAVMVNRVATARSVYRLLKEQGHDVVLLTGRMRPYDRDRVMEEWTPAGADKAAPKGLRAWFAAKPGLPALDRPVFVVATQCLECGANLDFEAIVSECASLDALRQRFGRLDRLGLHPGSFGVVVIRADQIQPKEDDPVYGAALPATWSWLQKQAGDAGTIDMGIDAMQKAIDAAMKDDGDFLKKLQPPALDAPVMLPAHVDCWVQTSPAPQPEPDVALFLHGPKRGTPDVQICWRRDLNPEGSDDQLLEAVSLCPPTSAECMAVPLPTFLRWLSGGTDATDESDVEGAAATVAEEANRGPERESGKVLRWRGPDESQLTSDPEEIGPGDTLVLTATAGGSEVFGHIPDHQASQPISDWAEPAFRRARATALLRLNPSIMASWPDSAAKAGLLDLVAPEQLVERFGEFEYVKELRGQLSDLSEADGTPTWLREVAAALAKDRKLHRNIFLHPFGGIVLRGSRRLPGRAGDSETFTDEDETASATVPVFLADHCAGVAEWVRAFAEGCGLSKELVEDLVLAAKLHDLGKADPRFQVWLHGGSEITARRSPRPLAKSGGLPLSAAARRAARERSGYPKGGRHELLSVRLAESAADALEHAHDRDLVLHLIASHHGHCRPLAPVVRDPVPVPVEYRPDGKSFRSDSTATGLERLDSGVAERFWRVVRRYGWWGIAWLEAILRLADHRRSESEQDEAEWKEERA